jgi:hypothetical protein
MPISPAMSRLDVNWFRSCVLLRFSTAVRACVAWPQASV